MIRTDAATILTWEIHPYIYLRRVAIIPTAFASLRSPLLSVCVQVGNLFTTPAYCAEQALLCRAVALRTTLHEDHPKKLFLQFLQHL